jgi:hypothetical protein
MNPMKRILVSFAQLRDLLTDLNFTATREKRGWVFAHSESGTMFHFRPYTPAERVNMSDLVGVQMHLDYRGLLAPEAFENRLTKTPA